jgi:hypothetical protein
MDLFAGRIATIVLGMIGATIGLFYLKRGMWDGVVRRRFVTLAGTLVDPRASIVYGLKMALVGLVMFCGALWIVFWRPLV